jgi:hypothetical protein
MGYEGELEFSYSGGAGFPGPYSEIEWIESFTIDASVGGYTFAAGEIEISDPLYY